MFRIDITLFCEGLDCKTKETIVDVNYIDVVNLKTGKLKEEIECRGWAIDKHDQVFCPQCLDFAK